MRLGTGTMITTGDMRRLPCILLIVMLLPSLLTTAQEERFYKRVGDGQRLCLRRVQDGKERLAVAVCRDVQRDAAVGGGMSGCLRLPEEVIYDGERYALVAIDDSAFMGSADLRAVVLPAGLHTIGDHAFDDCPSLHRLTVDCDSLGYAHAAFGGSTRIDTLIVGPTARSLQPYVFSGLAGIEVVLFASERAEEMRNVFFGNTSAATLCVGEQVERIPSFLCYNFTGLQRVVYEGRTVCTIGECAFVNCRELRTIVVPSGVEDVGANAFAYCDPQYVFFESERPPRMRGNPFLGLERYVHVGVPCGTRQYYVNTVVGHYFDALQYPDDCPLVRSGEVVYVHDTVWIHDTVFVGVAADDSADAEADETDRLRLEGKVLCIMEPRRLAGRDYQLFDHRGRLIAEGRVPDNAKGEYRIPLPKRKRYYIGFEGEAPVGLDVPTGEVK